MSSRIGLGIRGHGVVAEVDSFGHVYSGDAILRWVVAGDDRWYDPTKESSVRQTTREGFPIVVTKVRVPTGDATVIAYAVAASGTSVIVLEVRNESTLPFAMVLSDPAWRTVRTPVPMHDRATQDAMLAHVGLPQESVIHPIGHQAGLRFVYDPSARLSAEAIESLPNVDQIAAGWERALASATRLNVPDHGLVKDMNSIRCAMLLGAHEQENLVDQVIATNELIRMGEKSATNFDDVELNDYLGAIEDVLRVPRRGLFGRALRRRSASPASAAWYVDSMLTGAAFALHKLGQHRAADDVREARSRLGADSELPPVGDLGALSPMKRLARIDREFAHVATRGGGVCTDVLPLLSGPRIGNPNETWLGVNFEAHGLACIHGTVGYAVRWHGERAALLWEASEPTVLPLTSSRNDSHWHTNELRGEVLLEAPQA